MECSVDLVASSLAYAQAQSLPESTYRLQFHAGFSFRDAIRIIPYLRELGVTHVYASPFLKARVGSTHGYDIVDHRSLSPEICSREDLNDFVAALRKHDLRLIIDIVPNHMGVATNDNLWWNDVLENGPSSPFAGYFDIAWNDTPRPELKQKVLLPVLGDPYGHVLENGQIKLQYDGGQFSVWYWERRFPVAPRSYAQILSHRIEQLGQELGQDSLDFAEYQSILVAIGHLPDRTETDPTRVAERNREKEVIKRRLGDLAARNARIREFIDENVLAFKGKQGDPRSFDLLDDLLSHQCYRLSFWRVALEEINYRRFFDINDLAAICVERTDVFSAVHELVFRLIAEGMVDGLRIDHPDGLYDPQQYFLRLQREYLLILSKRAFESGSKETSESKWAEIDGKIREQIEAVLAEKTQSPARWPLFVVAEKILAASETVPSDWAIHGTCGYEFIRALTGLFIDADAEPDFTRLYRNLNPDYVAFFKLVYRSK
ncbi:MAG TPA: alpha-amylase family glycosyl hydrolase, partial [Gemmata sp.]|nr:alpha-amylase family glycosyl hydrolase [Gemmata sp.]